jgi:F0F1-type ATP synthase alpha subunit
MSIWQQFVSIHAVTSGGFDQVEPSRIKEAQAALLAKFEADQKSLSKKIDEGSKPTDEQVSEINKVVKTVAKGFEG